jgi:hypothetical protein
MIFDETRLLQNAKLLGNVRLRERKLMDHLADVTGTLEQELKDSETTGLSESFEGIGSN